jgi:hypothetical protein
LGSDTIIMGETSELGPIDAQVFIVEGNHEQQVSADHFLRARDEAIANLASTDQSVVQAAQIQLALLSPPFLQHCQDLMDFAKDFAGKQLRTHMFREEYQIDSTLWDSRIDKIIETLESSSKHLTHGRMITGQAILDDPHLKHLKVKLLSSDAPYWIALNEFLIRTDIVAHREDMGKILLAQDFEMFGR